MRGTDGIELQRRLHEIYPDMLVIIMTGYASVETAIAALKNGAYDYVNKPLDPDEIAHLIAKAMSHRRTQQENVAAERNCRRDRASLRHHRAERGDEASVRRHRDRGADRCHRAGHGRERHGQRTGGARHSCRQSAALSSPGGHPLRRADRDPAGERALRPRERRVHRRAISQEGQVRNRRRRHRIPRRDRRHQPEDPDRPAARVAGARDHARRRQPDHQGRFPRRRRHQQESGAAD